MSGGNFWLRGPTSGYRRYRWRTWDQADKLAGAPSSVSGTNVESPQADGTC